MNKELQNLSWACLPKEAREEIRDIVKTSGMGIHGMFDLVFGGNVTSDTEPEEMLMVERKKVQEEYSENIKIINESKVSKDCVDSDSEYAKGIVYVLKSLFGDKCLPDKEPSVQGEPKFNKGDRVRVISNDKYGVISRIVKVDEEDDGFFYTLDGVRDWRFAECNLEPCTEPETKDNMEEKELNLAELLKGCEGEEFYYILSGKRVTLDSTKYGIISIKIDDSHGANLLPNGSAIKGGIELLRPSEELYEKYPLDAYSAWMEWKEARKPKLEQEVYDYAKMCSMDVDGYKAIEAAVIFGMELAYKSSISEVREALQKFHEKNSEK